MRANTEDSRYRTRYRTNILGTELILALRT